MYSLIFFPPPADGNAGAAGNSLVSTLIMFGSVILIFYFMMIRPQQKRAKEHKALLDNIKRGDKVITTSGIHGTVSDVSAETILVQVADNTRITFDKGSIATVKSKDDSN